MQNRVLLFYNSRVFSLCENIPVIYKKYKHIASILLLNVLEEYEMRRIVKNKTRTFQHIKKNLKTLNKKLSNEQKKELFYLCKENLKFLSNNSYYDWFYFEKENDRLKITNKVLDDWYEGKI